MNKRGFSLVELLAVVSILAIISFIVSVPITKNIKEGNEKACRTQFETIIEAAKLWGNENIDLLPDNVNKKDTVTVETLKKEGFLVEDLINPATGEEISNDFVVFIEKTGNKRWKYTVDDNIVAAYCENIPIDEQEPVTLPIYSVEPSGDVWARSKIVTITYPERKDGYVYEYSIDGLDNWKTVDNGTTTSLTFTKNGNVTARIFDRKKYHTASTLSVTKIDTTAPTSVSATKSSSTSKSITVKANGTDSESGIGKYEFSKDNGTSWVSNGTNSTYTFTNLKTGSYQVKVRVTDKAGNATTSAAASMSTTSVTVPTYSVSPSGDVWARQKVVTITYPTRQTDYVYQYSVNGGSTWTTVSSGTTATYTFTANGNIIARIYDGVNYFSASTLSVTKIDKTAPASVSATKSSSTSKSITVKANGTDSESGIGKYEFSKDNGAIWISNGTSNTYTFTNLKTGSYQVKVRVTDKVRNAATSAVVSMSTSSVTVPTYSVSPSGDAWAKSKKVTITYPARQTGFVYQYSVNGGSSWTTVSSGTTATYTFNKNGNIIARIYDGLNYYTASTLSVTKVDQIAPINVSAIKAATTSKSITVKANGTDSESGIGKYEFSKDNGSSWIDGGTNNTYTFTNLKAGSYNIKVRITDKVGNVTTSAVVSMSTSSVVVPTYSVNPSGDVWARSKVVTITYPERQDEFVYQYSVNGGSSWVTVSSGTTAIYTFNANGNIIARINDGTNYYNASTLSVTKIDRTPPQSVSATKVANTNNSITVKANGTDNESGIGKYEFSKDNGSSWIDGGTNNTYTFTNLKAGSYNIKVRVTDKVGNVTTSESIIVKIGYSLPFQDGKAIYFNPETGKICNDYVASNSLKEHKNGCMKWYTFGGNNDSDTVNLLLDHNTTYMLAFNSNNNNKDGSEVDAKLSKDIQTWLKELNPRLITADEIAKITGNTKFNSLTAGEDDMFYFDTNTSEEPIFQGSDKSKFAWLYDNTISCIKYGCSVEDNGTYGYWTSTKVATNETDVWRISRYGYMKTTSSDNSNYGIRPVITVSKEDIKDSLLVPTYSVKPAGDVWARSKTVTITYPTRQNGFIYQYSVDGGSSWTTVSSGTTATYTFTANGNIIARIYDGTNYYTASTLSVTKIDNVVPINVSASKVYVGCGDMTIKANGIDNESGIGKYEFSRDNGMSWINNSTNNIYTFTNLDNGSYQVKVRVTDKVGNVTISSATQIIVGPESFATDSWETISCAVQDNDLDKYKVGDEKEVTLTGDYAGTYTVRIANTSKPAECDGADFSQSACGFVVEFKDIITTAQMNSAKSNEGGWPASEMYTLVNTNIYNSLPVDLKNVIIDTDVVSSHGSSDPNNFKSTDKLYLLATKEVWGKEGTSNTVNQDSSDNQTRQLDYYKSIGVTTSNYSGAIKQYNGRKNIWWLRTTTGSSTGFYIVALSGDWNSSFANDILSIAPAFRIG